MAARPIFGVPVPLALAAAFTLALGAACDASEAPGLGDAGVGPSAPDLASPEEDMGAPDLGEPDLGPADLGYRPGCGEARFQHAPIDPAARGPWAVGARTASVAGLTTEIWYPAAAGSEAGQAPARYDMRTALPESERTKVSDADNPLLDCDCFRDLPLDTTHGPYPVVVFVHGTAGVRYQSLPQMTHWASRGFVVVSADIPGLDLQDSLRFACGQGMTERDDASYVRTLIDAVRSPTEGLGFLAGAIDAARIGLAGHSAGGGAVSDFSDDAQVIIPLASRGVADGAALESVLIMGGTSDRVVAPSVQRGGFRSAPSPKRLVMLENAGHLAFSVFCSLRNPAGQNIIEVAQGSGVCGTLLASFLFDCNDAYLSEAEAWPIINHATTAAFEATLQCRETSEAELSATGARFPMRVSTFEEEL